MTDQLLTTPLHQWHASHGGRMVDFAGWSMPVQYQSIVAEHQATRNAVGLFDVSHMGRFRLTGEGAAAFVDRMVTRRVADMPMGKIRYALVVNEQGGILDDVLVYRLAEAQGPLFQAQGPCFYIVVNAGNRQKIASWFEKHLADEQDVHFADNTTASAMIAVQGPGAIALADPLVDVDLSGMKYYNGQVASIDGAIGIVSRTGYTGEDGCELIVPADAAVGVWTKLVQEGGSPVGLGARDTLRLEAAMPLYGHELSESINPVQADLKFAVNLKDREFIGRDAIAKVWDDPSQPRRVGLEISGRRPAREGYPVKADGRQIGAVTSGTHSPTLERPIAMALVEPQFADLGARLEIEARGKPLPAEVVSLPFYQRSKA